MRGQIRIRSTAYDVRRVVNFWQLRYNASGAVHFADPSTVLIAADIEVEALEKLLRWLRPTEVEVMWRGAAPLPAAAFAPPAAGTFPAGTADRLRGTPPEA